MDMMIKDNLAIQLVELCQKALLSKHNPCPFDGEQTRVVIEFPDSDEVVPMAYAWYDKENNTIRIGYEL